jgi:hypothetical protein
VGSAHACGLRPDGSVVCWGDDTGGATAAPALSFVSLEAGGAPGAAGHTCGVTAGGSIACWGANGSDQSEPPYDSDLDGLEDPVDNCPVDANANQLDSDNDGVGDACDNRSGTQNPDQFDGTATGGRFATTASAPRTRRKPIRRSRRTESRREPALPFLVENPGGGGMLASSMFQTASDAYDVYLACGPDPIKRVESGLILPTEIAPENADFGPGCTYQNCNDATTMGPTVSESQSFVVDPTTSTGGRSDSIYFVLQGDGAPDNRLCNPNSTHYLASIAVASFPTDASRPTFTEDGVDSVTANSGPDNFTDQTFTEVSGDELEFDQYVFASGNNDSTLIDLEIPPDSTDSSGRTWYLTLTALEEIEKLTIGIIPPAGSTYQQIQLVGCTNQGNINIPGTGSCQVAEGPYVDKNNSRTQGPDPTPPSGVRPDTMYVTLAGNRSGLNWPTLSLNVKAQPVMIGRVFVQNGVPNVAPGLTTSGAATVMGTSDPFVRADTFDVGDYDYSLIGSGQAVEDSDGDGFVNNTDNCLYERNDQADNGGLDTSDADRRGDACQCGDGNHDGEVRTADVMALRQVLAGQTSDLDAKELCSVSGDTVCDVKDMLVLVEKLQNPTGGLPPACARSYPPGLPVDP